MSDMSLSQIDRGALTRSCPPVHSQPRVLGSFIRRARGTCRRRESVLDDVQSAATRRTHRWQRRSAELMPALHARFSSLPQETSRAGRGLSVALNGRWHLVGLPSSLGSGRMATVLQDRLVRQPAHTSTALSMRHESRSESREWSMPPPAIPHRETGRTAHAQGSRGRS